MAMLSSAVRRTMCDGVLGWVCRWWNNCDVPVGPVPCAALSEIPRGNLQVWPSTKSERGLALYFSSSRSIPVPTKTRCTTHINGSVIDPWNTQQNDWSAMPSKVLTVGKILPRPTK